MKQLLDISQVRRNKKSLILSQFSFSVFEVQVTVSIQDA